MRALSRSTFTLRQPSGEAPWVALAGSRAGAKPEKARDASRRRPSTSALLRNSTWTRRASVSTSSRNAVPLGGSRISCWANSARSMRARPASSWVSGAITTRSSEKRSSVSMSGSSTGRFTTARSSRFCTSSGTSEVVVASKTITSMPGWTRFTSSRSRGTIHRAVVPITPIVTVPLRLARKEPRSSLMACNSSWIRRARSATTWPSGVRHLRDLSISVAPASRSRREMCAETLDCTVCRARAASEKLRCSATASRTFSWRRSIASNDTNYRYKLLN